MAAKKKPQTPDITYSEGASELEGILSEIESGVDIDLLSQKVERAAELIRVCKAKLTETELRVQKVVGELVADEQEEEADA